MEEDLSTNLTPEYDGGDSTSGESYLHLLAKQNNVSQFKEYIQQIQNLEDNDEKFGLEKDMTNGLLLQEKVNKNTPLMLATLKGASEFVEVGVKFLLQDGLKEKLQVERLLSDQCQSQPKNKNKNKVQIHDTLFTLMMKNIEDDDNSFSNALKLLMEILFKFFSQSELNKWFVKLLKQLIRPNSCDCNGYSMTKLIELFNNTGIAIDGGKNIQYSEVLSLKDVNGHNILMSMAKNEKDDALREFLTNTVTSPYVTHDVLSHKNYFGQTLLALIEINQESLLESLIIIIRLELTLHNNDIRLAENSLRNHLESSESTHAIISLLHQQIPASLCYKIYNWTILVLVTLITGVGLTFFDIYSDIFISTEYYRNMTNSTAVDFLDGRCSHIKQFNEETIGFKLPIAIDDCKTENDENCDFPFTYNEKSYHTCTKFGYDQFWCSTDVNKTNRNYIQDKWGVCKKTCPTDVIAFPTAAFEYCFNYQSRFSYTLFFILLTPVFWLFEFLTIRDDYEPTGLRQKIKDIWKNELTKYKCSLAYVRSLFRFLGWIFVTFLAIVLWQPLTCVYKMWTDGKYFINYTGIKKVQLRQAKRRNDLVASRGELVEVNIEATFEPIVQGYIMFPNAVSIANRLYESVKFDFSTWKLDITFQLTSIESVQLFSITTSILSLAWCFSEYISVKKNMYLDIFASPFSRIVMVIYMILSIVARLLSFMIFSLYWSPGDFYPVIIFVLIHMFISAGIHVVFSEDIAYWKNHQYGKFFHNVMMNSFACIYFHNYLRFEEEEIIHLQPPGTHISTFVRQLLFETLYVLEFVILLSLGLSANVWEVPSMQPFIVEVVLILYLLSTLLKLFYYGVMHIWAYHILNEKIGLVNKAETANGGGTSNEAFEDTNESIDDKEDDVDKNGIMEQLASNNSSNIFPLDIRKNVDNIIQIQDVEEAFFKYVLILRNTWILGTLQQIEQPLPTRIIDGIKEKWKSLKTDLNMAVLNFQRKSINNVINFMAFVLGIAMIIIGITILVNATNYGIFYQVDNLKEKFMGFSLIMIVIGALFCLLDIEEKRNGVPVYIFWALLSLSLMILFGLLITIIVQNGTESVHNEVQLNMQEYIQRYDNGNETIDDSWNYLQTTLKCCGVDNYTNWENNQKFTDGTLLPESCCDKSSSCTIEATYNKYNTKGCLEEILRQYDYQGMAIGIGVTIISIVILWKIFNPWAKARDIGYPNDFFLIMLSVVVILMLLIILLLTAPILICVFWYQIYKNGKRSDVLQPKHRPWLHHLPLVHLSQQTFMTSNADNQDPPNSTTITSPEESDKNTDIPDINQ